MIISEIFPGLDMDGIQRLLKQAAAEISEIDDEIGRIVGHRGVDGLLLYDIMRYHMGWKDEELRPTATYGGKRIRPILCLTVSEAIKGDHQAALPVAAAIELVHNSSIVVDDIYDKSSLRRSRPAAWTIWGPQRAIVAGLSIQALMNVATLRLQENDVPPAKIFRILQKLSDTLLEMCEGQFMDMSFEETPVVSVEDYLMMVHGKTAALIECATYCGALLATDDEKLIQHYGSFGRKVGIAFQIIDDILGIWGRPEITGKPRGIDLKSKKKTLPFLYGLAVAEPEKRERITKIYAQESVTEADCIYLFQTLTDLEADQYCRRVVSQYLKEAEDELHQTGIENAAQERLIAITRFVGSRIY